MNGCGGEDVPQGGEIYTFLENVSPGFLELFQLALKGVGVICATTLDQFAGVEESFIGLQVEEFEALTWTKLLLVRALQALGGKKRPRVPQSSTNEPEPDAGSDEEAGRHGNRKDETTKRSGGRRESRSRSSSSESSDSGKLKRASARRRRKGDRKSNSSSDGGTSNERENVKKGDKKTRQSRPAR